jgi:hypothetical protein
MLLCSRLMRHVALLRFTWTHTAFFTDRSGNSTASTVKLNMHYIYNIIHIIDQKYSSVKGCAINYDSPLRMLVDVEHSNGMPSVIVQVPIDREIHI